MRRRALSFLKLFITNLASGQNQPYITRSSAAVLVQVITRSDFTSGVNDTDAHASLGLAEHIREAYSFICNNYDPGDEIFLIGFSRGAFTARTIGTLIGAIGLLNRQGLVYFYQIFQDWQNHLKPDWKSPYPNEPWENRPPTNTPEYRRKLLELELTRPDMPIKAIGVWDTVGGTYP
jgi:uncharacterized protein (DUF2235 family)